MTDRKTSRRWVEAIAVVLILSVLAAWCAIVRVHRQSTCTRGSIVSYLTNCEAVQ